MDIFTLISNKLLLIITQIFTHKKNIFMKTSENNALIFDNQFSWRYVGLILLMLIFEAMAFAIMVLISDYLITSIFSFLTGENLHSSINEILLYVGCIFIFIMLLEHLFISLPKMSSGQYRLDSEHLYIKEKFCGETIIDEYISIKSIDKVSYKTDYFRWLLYPFKHIEIQVNGVKCNIFCHKHKDELYAKLKEYIEFKN